MGMDDEILMVLVIVVPILILLSAIFLCCWCCQCCCCAKPPQQVVLYPSNPNNSTVVNTTLMSPYNQGYTQLPTGYSQEPNQGYLSQPYAHQQHQHYQQSPGQYAQQGHSSGYQGTPDNHLLLTDCPTKSYQNEHMDPTLQGYQQMATTSMTNNGHSKPEGYQDERTGLPVEYTKPPAYSSLH